MSIWKMGDCVENGSCKKWILTFFVKSLELKLKVLTSFTGNKAKHSEDFVCGDAQRKNYKKCLIVQKHVDYKLDTRSERLCLCYESCYLCRCVCTTQFVCVHVWHACSHPPGCSRLSWDQTALREPILWLIWTEADSSKQNTFSPSTIIVIISHSDLLVSLLNAYSNIYSYFFSQAGSVALWMAALLCQLSQPVSSRLKKPLWVDRHWIFILEVPRDEALRLWWSLDFSSRADICGLERNCSTYSQLFGG